MAICWERTVLLAFHLCCFYFSAVLVVRVPFPFGVWGRVWNSIVSFPAFYLLSYQLPLEVVFYELYENGKCQISLSIGPEYEMLSLNVLALRFGTI